MAQSPFEIKKEICDIGKRIYDHGFVAANDGNISVKVGPNEFYCTPTGVSKGFMTPDEMDNAMNKKSGLLGVSGISNDGREVWAAADAGNERAKLAMDLMARGALKLIGTYTAEMNGLDVLVFTAGVGENDRRTREGIAGNLSFFGIDFDKEKNMTAPHDGIVEISKPDSKVKVLVIPTDEEYMIACDTEALAKAL